MCCETFNSRFSSDISKSLAACNLIIFVLFDVDVATKNYCVRSRSGRPAPIRYYDFASSSLGATIADDALVLYALDNKVGPDLAMRDLKRTAAGRPLLRADALEDLGSPKRNRASALRDNSPELKIT